MFFLSSVFSLQAGGLQYSSVLETTAAQEADTTTVPSTVVDSSDPNTTTVYFIFAIIVLVLVVALFCLRRHVNSLAYKSVLKRFRRISRTSESGEVEVNVEYFQPPPDYSVALDMPKPASRAGDSDNGGGNDQTAASTTTNATDGQNTDSGEADADQSLETPGEPDEEGENVAGMCTVVVRVDEDTKSVDEFIILEHVKRMAQDPSAAVSALPTYQDFIVQFPEYM